MPTLFLMKKSDIRHDSLFGRDGLLGECSQSETALGDERCYSLSNHPQQSSVWELYVGCRMEPEEPDSATKQARIESGCGKNAHFMGRKQCCNNLEV